MAWKKLAAILGGLLLALGLTRCGGGGGGGDDTEPSPSPTLAAVTVQGVVNDGVPTSPVGQAMCRFVDQSTGTSNTNATADTAGHFVLQIAAGVQGVIQCQHSLMPSLMLSAFISTVDEAAGTIITEEVTPASQVIADIIAASAPADPQIRKLQLQADLANGEPNLTALVEAAAIIYKALLETQTAVAASFGGTGESTGEGGGDGDAPGADDGGGATADAGDGAEFSPIPGAVCMFSLDSAGLVRANTVLADLFADGQLDRLDVQPVAERVHTVLRPERRRAIREAFRALFPSGLGQSASVTASDARSATPGRFFLPTPIGVPGVIHCHPPDQPNLVVTTCIPARAAGEILSGQVVTPRSDVICDLASQLRQADPSVDREATTVDLSARVIPLQIFLSEDRNGNGVLDPDEEDEDRNGVLDTNVRIRSILPLPEEDRDLALLVSTATTIFDEMRLLRNSLPPGQTFGAARRDFFTNGAFSAPLAPLETSLDATLQDETNQAVLGTVDVVQAATTGTLRGNVRDDRGRPLVGVQVLAVQQGRRVNVRDNPATTDANGAFRIPNIPTGETTVTASLNGVEVAKTTTTVVAVVTLNLRLQPAAEITLNQSTLAFGEVPVGESRALPVTVSNSGTRDLAITALTVETAGTPAYVRTHSPQLPVTLVPGASITLQIAFRPTTVGPNVGALKIASNALNAAEGTVLLRGRGATVPVPQIEVTPPALAFGELQLRAGQDNTETKSVAIRNAGSAPLALSALTIDQQGSASFALGSGSPGGVTVAPGAQVRVTVVYRPNAVGTTTGTLRIRSNAANAPDLAVALGGRSVAAPVPNIDVNPMSLDFGDVYQGRQRALAVTIANSGTAALRITRLALTGGPGNAFTLQDAPRLPVSIEAGASLTFESVYQPNALGTLTGTLRVESNAGNTAQLVLPLSGTGVAAPQPQVRATPEEGRFGETPVGTPQPLPLTLANTGTAELVVNALSLGGDAAFTLASAPTLPLRLAPAASIALDLRFRPRAEGTVTGTLHIDSTASSTPRLVVPLSGTGVALPQPQVQATPGEAHLDDTPVGSSQSLALTLANTGTAELVVNALRLEGDAAFTLTSAPTLPLRLPPAASIALDLRFRPRAEGTVTATFRAESNASNTPQLVVPLSATGVAAPQPQARATPEEARFREVPVEMAQTVPLTLANPGTAALVVTALTLEGDAAFTLTSAPTLPLRLAPAASVTLTLRFLPQALGTVTGTLRVDSDASNAPQLVIPLSGTAVAAPQPQVRATPGEGRFDDVPVGMFQTLPLRLANQGTAALTVTALFFEGNTAFALANGPTLPLRLAPAASVTLTLRFLPQALGTVTGTLHIDSDASNAPQLVIPLSGTGAAVPEPQVQATPTEGRFGETPVGTPQPLPLTLANTGTAELVVNALSLGGDAAFTLASAPTLPLRLAPAASIALDLRFRPRAEGTVTGTLHIDSTASSTPRLVVPLSGTGVALPQPQVQATPGEARFGEVLVGMPQALPLTLSNPGTAPLAVTALTFDGDAAFTLANGPTLPLRLAPAGSATLTLQFLPEALGTVTGTLQIDSDASNTPQLVVPLSGTGVAAPQPQVRATPGEGRFDDVPVGTSQTLSLTLVNTGTAELVVEALSFGGDAAFALANGPTLPLRLAPAASVTLTLRFLPQALGTVTGTLQIDSDASNAPQLVVPLSGTGTEAPQRPRRVRQR